MPKANQLHVKREDVNVTCADLLQMPKGTRTLEGLRLNTRVGVQYLAAWMTGTGSVPLYNLMEDAATAEISRVQNWQQIKYNAVLDGGLVPGKSSSDMSIGNCIHHPASFFAKRDMLIINSASR